MQLPEGHQTIMPYLILKEAAKFSDFAKEVFHAKVKLNKLRDDKKTIMHSELTMGNSTIMFADSNQDWAPQNANLFVYVPNANETYHKALDHGATSKMELTDQDYGRTCGVMDPFGNTWWITSINK
ncbi:MAG: VOC family protein [Cyclobacteriaceae bacterium]|nr:VOC family protein [Cyclobacteriaceae bacterium]